MSEEFVVSWSVSKFGPYTRIRETTCKSSVWLADQTWNWVNIHGHCRSLPETHEIHVWKLFFVELIWTNYLLSETYMATCTSSVAMLRISAPNLEIGSWSYFWSNWELDQCCYGKLIGQPWTFWSSNKYPVTLARNMGQAARLREIRQWAKANKKPTIWGRFVPPISNYLKEVNWSPRALKFLQCFCEPRSINTTTTRKDSDITLKRIMILIDVSWPHPLPRRPSF